MKVFALSLAVALVSSGIAFAQAAKPGLEPGQAEAMNNRRTVGKVVWTQPPVETRGIWVASRDMDGSSAEIAAKVDQIKKANLNTVLIDTVFRGFVAYPGSSTLPVYPDFKGGDGDVFKAWIDACHARGLKAEAWMEYGFYAYFTPDAKADKSMGAVLDKEPELLSVDAKGNRSIHREFGDFYSYCPSNPRVHVILAKLYAETATKYPIDGMNLDRIRYAGGDYCYCDYCKTHFKSETGLELKVFEKGSAEAKTWLEWKRERTAMAVATIAKAVRAVRPGMPITSYVVGPDEMDDKAQGWDLWVKQGSVDALAVSMYGADIEPACQKAIKLMGGSDKLICAVNAAMSNDIFASNIEIGRKHTRLGQYIWHFGDFTDDVESLAKGPYQQPANSPSLAK